MIWCTSSRPRPPSIGSSAHFLFPSFNAELRCFIKKKTVCFIEIGDREREKEREGGTKNSFDTELGSFDSFEDRKRVEKEVEQEFF